MKDGARFLPSKTGAPPLLPAAHHSPPHHQPEPLLYPVLVKHLGNGVNNSGEESVAICRRCLRRMLS